MENRYKIILSHAMTEKEIRLDNKEKQIRIGTEADCSVRLSKKDIPAALKLTMRRFLDGWEISCPESMVLEQRDGSRWPSKMLSHGEMLTVKDKGSGAEIVNLEYQMDFGLDQAKYDRWLDISGLPYVLIGDGPQNHVSLRGHYIRDDRVILNRDAGGYTLCVDYSLFGVYHNAVRLERQAPLRDGDFFSIADYSFCFRDGRLWTQNRRDMEICGMPFEDQPCLGSYPAFVRNTRLKKVVDETEIEILDPPAKPKKSNESIFLRLLPSVGMLAAAGFLAMRGGAAMLIFSGFSAGIGILTGVLGYRKGNEQFRKDTEERLTRYRTYISQKRSEVHLKREQEQNTLRQIYLGQEDLLREIAEFSPHLFERQPQDSDYLCVWLGYGFVEARRKINYRKQEKLEIEDDLAIMPEKICKEYAYIPEAPVFCNLNEVNAVGIAGKKQDRFEVFKNMVIDLAARHYYTDVQMIFIAKPENRSRIHWLRMLPHAYIDEIGTRGIVVNEDSKTLIFEYLYKELTRRAEEKAFSRHILVFFYDNYGFQNHPVSRFLPNARELGVTFIFLEDHKVEILPGCDFVINTKGQNAAWLIRSEDSSEGTRFTFPVISDEQAEKIVRFLSPVYTEEVSLESTLTSNYSLFEMLNIQSAQDLDLSGQWARSQAETSMAAPLGIARTGIVMLDLHDKEDGPHGLVAGTTGSGKSEILQTYVLSMAARFHPYEVGFVIIDFKGGGMVNQFRELPHLIGAITNIDGKEIDRSLKSIRAELVKRQRLFEEAQVNHIDKYIRKFKKGDVSVPLPHLIIIVDEFAELKAEQPEFMKELISAARIGRSLGVHLILATQKPSGQVSEQIWSNSRFKLCLKVQDTSDSNEVLKSPLAAEIKEPGRAYLQVGNNERFELFQSAYSGGSCVMEEADGKEFAIYKMNDSGKRSLVYQKKRAKKQQASLTQLEAIVQHVESYCRSRNIERLPDICLPPLKDYLLFPQEYPVDPEECRPAAQVRADETAGTWDESRLLTAQVRADETKGIRADIGIYDDPDNQFQGTYSVDLSVQNLMILGSSLSGKTCLLQTIIRSLTTRYTPQEVQIYILDFASMVLKNFESLNHVGGVVCHSDDEKLRNLFKLLHHEIDTRKTLLASMGLSSFAAYKEAGHKDLSFIVVMIDNLTALRELYFEDDYELINLCRECLAAGISIVAANPQIAGIGYKYLSSFAGRIALYCNDPGEYSNLLEHCTLRPDNIPGRCLITLDKEIYECQAFMAFEGEKEIDRIESISRYIAQTNRISKGARAVRIPVIPDLLTQRDLLDILDSSLWHCPDAANGADFAVDDRGAAANGAESAMQYHSAAGGTGAFRRYRWDVAAGLDYDSVEPVVFNMASVGMLSLTGKAGGGKHNWVQYMLHVLEQRDPDSFRLYILDGVRRRLAGWKEHPRTARYSILSSDAAQYMKDIEAELQRRYQAMMEGSDSVLDNSDLLILIIDNIDALQAISMDLSAEDSYQNIMGKYRSMNVCLILLCVENANISYSSPRMLQDVRDKQNFILFDDISRLKIFEPMFTWTKEYKKPVTTGDAYYVRDGQCQKLKTPLAEQR